MAEYRCGVWIAMKRLIPVCVVLLIAAVCASTAHASATLFVTAEQHHPGQVTSPKRFEAIFGYPDQCVSGIVCWQYQKGSRSSNAHWPESWYLHVNGVRVKDRTFHLFVMDPRGKGWQQHVASACAQHCFLDGMGTSSISRTTPRISWSAAQWSSAAALVVRAVVNAGKKVLPNSVGMKSTALIAAAGGRGSTESYGTASAKQVLGLGKIWVTEIGNCLAKYHAFLHYKGRGDHFACYMPGHLPWDTSWL
jgi:hypothetical protein